MAELQKAEIVERIKRARIEAGLTQPELAELLDVGLRTYQNYEANRVPWGLMSRISDVTGCSVRWLLHGEEEPGSSPELMRRLSSLERMVAEIRAATPRAAGDAPEWLGQEEVDRLGREPETEDRDDEDRPEAGTG